MEGPSYRTEPDRGARRGPGLGADFKVSVVELWTEDVRSHWVVTAEAPKRGGRKGLGQWVGKEGKGYRDTLEI